MKKFILSLVVLLGILSVVSCGGNVTVKELEVSGQKTEFVLGEKFETGNIKVVAKLSDGTSPDVTKDAKVNGPASLEVAGTYAVIVSYLGQNAAYQISVSAPEKGPKNYDSVEAALNAGLVGAQNVKSGSAVIGQWGDEIPYSYEFGQNYLKVSTATEWYSEDLHYELQADESVFGVRVDGEGYVSQIVEPSNLAVNGIDFSGIVNYSAEVYGVEALVKYFYDQSQLESASNYAESIEACPLCDAHIAYEFSYHTIGEGQYDVITVSFSLGEEEHLSQASVVIDVYYSEEDLEYDEEDNIIGLVEGHGKPDYSHSVKATQEAGERTLVNEHSAAKYLYESFDLLDGEGNNVDGKEVELAAGSVLTLNVANASPEGANSTVDEIKVFVTDAEGMETFYAYGSCYEGLVEISAFQMGTYYVTVSSYNVSKSFTLVVTEPAVSEFYAAVYNGVEYVATSSTTAYVGASVEIGAVVNQYADASFTATISKGDASAKLELSGSSYLFTAAVLGTYEVLLTSKENAEFTATLTIEVVAAPTVAELLTGKWSYVEDWGFTLLYEFQPASEGATSGTCVITYTDFYSGEATVYTIKYAYADGQLSYTNEDGEELTMNDYAFILGANYTLVAAYGDGYEIGTLERVDESSIAGEYLFIEVNPKTGWEIYNVLILNEDGTGSYELNSQVGAHSGEFKWELVGEEIVFSDVVALYGTEPVELVGYYVDGVIILTYGMMTNEFVKQLY